jgi:pimeloyl-[acyl-carrier protein] synthase
MDIDIFSNEFCQNKYFFYEEFRKKGNVVFSPMSNAWLIIGYQEASDVFIDSQNFSPAEMFAEIDPVLFGSIQPQHLKNRKVLQKASPFYSVKCQEETFINLYKQLSNKLIQRFHTFTTIDLLDDFIIPYTISVSLRTIGLENMDDGKFDILSDKNDIDETLSHLLSIYYDMESIESLFYKKEGSYQISEKIRLNSINDRNYSSSELLQFFKMLFLAGFETTTGLLSNLSHLLLHNKQLLLNLSEDLSNNLSPYIIESLRYFSPTHMTYRTCENDKKIGGQMIKKGENVAILIGAANRDPDVFAQPEHFDILRNNNSRHIAFGKGTHFCLGYHVAIASITSALNELTPYLLKMKIINSDISYGHSIMVNKLTQIKVEQKI